MQLSQFLQLFPPFFVSDINKRVGQKINLQKTAKLKKVGLFATPIPFFVGPTRIHRLLVKKHDPRVLTIAAPRASWIVEESAVGEVKTLGSKGGRADGFSNGRWA